MEEEIAKLQQQRAAMQQSANRSMLLGDHDGPEERAEEERTDAQASAGADEPMAQALETVATPNRYPPGGGAAPGGAAGGSSGEEPAAKRMHTGGGGVQKMEDVEREAGVSEMAIRRELPLPSEAEVTKRIAGQGLPLLDDHVIQLVGENTKRRPAEVTKPNSGRHLSLGWKFRTLALLPVRLRCQELEICVMKALPDLFRV